MSSLVRERALKNKKGWGKNKDHEMFFSMNKISADVNRTLLGITVEELRGRKEISYGESWTHLKALGLSDWINAETTTKTCNWAFLLWKQGATITHCKSNEAQ